MSKIVKLFSCTLLIALLCIFCTTFAFADSQQEDYVTTEQFQFLSKFVTENPSRSGSEGELQAANWLRQRFAEVVDFSNVGMQTFDIYTDGGSYKSQNVIAKIDVENVTQKVVIGAHYDCIGQGANDNASGVTALYFTLKELWQNKDSLTCDVEVVAFGGEEEGLYGSQAYVATHGDTSNILAMFNFDCIANGDNLYYSCELVQTDFAQLIGKNGQNQPFNLQQKPFGIGVFNDIFGTSFLGYYDMTTQSDQAYFRLDGVPTVIFFSGTFSNFNYAESKNPSKNTLNTSNDTLQNLQNFNGKKLVDKIITVTNTTVNTLLSTEFGATAQNARSQLVNLNFWFSPIWPRIAVFVILVIVVALACLHYRKLQKGAIMGNATVNNKRIFDKPDAEDIFTFD